MTRGSAGIMNLNPELYDKTNKLQERDGLELLKRVRDDLKKGLMPCEVQKVVDIGCGTGNITDRFFEFIPARIVVGIDLSDAMVKYAEDHHSSESISYLTADVTSIRSLEPVGLGSADVILSIHCLHWIQEEDQGKAVTNIWKLLKPGGRCYLLVFSWSDMLPLQEQLIYHPKWRKYFKSVIEAGEEEKSDSLDVVKEKSRRRRSSAPFPTFDPPPAEERIRLWEQRCSDNLFQDVNVTLQKARFDFGNWASFREELKSICHFLPYIPREEQNSFLEDYYEHVKNTYTNRPEVCDDEPSLLDYEYLLVQATKPSA